MRTYHAIDCIQCDGTGVCEYGELGPNDPDTYFWTCTQCNGNGIQPRRMAGNRDTSDYLQTFDFDPLRVQRFPHHIGWTWVEAGESQLQAARKEVLRERNNYQCNLRYGEVRQFAVSPVVLP